MSVPIHVQSATPVNNNGAAATGPVITLTGVVVGNEIVVWGSWGSSNTTPTCADDKGNTYAPQAKIYSADNNQGLCGFAAKVAIGGTVVISVAWGGSAEFRTVFAEEKSGVDATTDIDVASVGQAQASPGTGADGISTTPFTTVTADCLICACAADIAVGNLPGVGSVGTSRSSNAGGAGLRSEDWAAGAAGSKTSNFTALADVLHLSVQMALRPAAGGGGANGFIPQQEPMKHMVLR